MRRALKGKRKEKSERLSVPAATRIGGARSAVWPASTDERAARGPPQARTRRVWCRWWRTRRPGRQPVVVGWGADEAGGELATGGICSSIKVRNCGASHVHGPMHRREGETLFAYPRRYEARHSLVCIARCFHARILCPTYASPAGAPNPGPPPPQPAPRRACTAKGVPWR